MFRVLIAGVALMCAHLVQARPVAVAPGIRLIPGSSSPDRQPDGNSVLIDAPDGLILVDTGRHTSHQAMILAVAEAEKRPVAAVFNTHWHLDHSGGNGEIRAVFPAAPLYASNAIDGALRGFLPTSRREAEQFLLAGKASAGLAEDIALDMAAVDNPLSLRPSVPVTTNRSMKVAGRTLDVHLAPFAATESDVWLYDRQSRVLIAGDLVVAAAPYFDTACPDGWRSALAAIAGQNFRILIPGHGAPMTRVQFLRWKKSFDTLLDCAASTARNAACIAGWKRDAAEFIPAGSNAIDGLIEYYLETRLRAAPAERVRYCKPQ